MSTINTQSNQDVDLPMNAMAAQRDILEKQLRKLGAGATVEEFVAQADQVDPDAIESRIERLREEIKGLQHERSLLDQKIGSERTVLDGMDGSGTPS